MCSCLTTSGKSKNVARALQEAKARDLLVKSDSTARVQEAHQLLLHVLCEIIESRIND
jgi:phosphoheptose isomerase